ncbi:MAG: CAP domain-containing protein [Actinomycetota bacterium]
MLRTVRTVLAATLVAGAIGWGANATFADPVSGAKDVLVGAQATETATRGERIEIRSAPAPAPAPTPAPAPVPAPSVVALDPLLVTVLELTNAERAAVGLAPLVVDPLLNEAAQFHSDDQARRNELTHFGVNGESPGDRIRDTGYRFRTWAENAAMGYRTAEHVMEGWMNSPGHRDNILRSTVTEIGLGLAYTDTGVPYWTQKFATPRT